MRLFTPKPGSKSAIRILDAPFAGIEAFDAMVQTLVRTNPLGCTPYMSGGRNHPPVEVVREMYTAKFVYLDKEKKQIGRSIETYDSVEGYQDGLAAVVSNMANIAAHRGKARHTPVKDTFSVLLKCHDPGGEMFFVSLARDRITVASYTDDGILARAEKWADSVPELA